MESLCNLIQHIKETDTGWELLFKQLQPLIRKSAKKLFFLEYEDAEQEICLAVFSAVQTISHYNSDGECLKYIANGIHFACSALFSKSSPRLPTVPLEDYLSSRQSSMDSCLSDIEYFSEISKRFAAASPRKKEIIIYLLQGYKDSEIAARLKISRQYVSKVKHEFFQKRD